MRARRFRFRMNKLTTWQRLNAGTAAIIGLILLGLSVAFVMERANSAADQRASELNFLRDRINLDLSQMSDALRGLLIDPKNETERNHLKTVETDFLSVCDPVQPSLGNHPGLANALKNLREFDELTLNPFQTHVIELADANLSGATTYYTKNVQVVHDKRDQVLSGFKSQLDAAINENSESAKNTAIFGLCGIGLILAACAVVGWMQSRAVSRPLSRLVDALEEMRRGDFTHRIAMNRPDEFGVIGDGLDRLANDLSVLVGQVQRSGIQVNMTSTEIAATAKQQQSTANEIAATTAEIGATSKQISATSKELVKTMTEVAEVAGQTAATANTGQSSITRMENTMRQIIDASGSINAKLAVLSEKTANINSVVTTITKVADQTNLLSLNAAIEAEKAGEYGLGFAVVAMEIRRLADQTAVSTYDIEKMVKEMQSAVAAGVMGMDKFSEEVRRGVDDVRHVSAQLAQIIHQVQALTPRFQTVSEGMHTQSTGAQQISETLGQLSEGAQQTAESLRQSNLAIEQLNDAARGLQTSIAKFKLEG